MIKRFLSAIVTVAIPILAFCQHDHNHHQHQFSNTHTDPQPLLANALRLVEGLSFIGASISDEHRKALERLRHEEPSQSIVKSIQGILDPYCIAHININPEARVKVSRGAAPPLLMQNAWTAFLVKVENLSGMTSRLEAESPNALSPVHTSPLEPVVREENRISKGEVFNRFLDIRMYEQRPLSDHLSGQQLEYAIIQIYCKETGKKEVSLGFNAGGGKQDIGFRNAIHTIFDSRPAVKVKLNITDETNLPSMASLVITDSIQRYPGRLAAFYPLPSRRVAATDEYPDFYFQKQIYRQDGEHVYLSPGKYTISYGKGPEYIQQPFILEVPDNRDAITVSLSLKRWIDPASKGYYSADSHIHGAGCSHYESPEEGVDPSAMMRQIEGESLNVGAVLTWMPNWYYQKRYFTGRDNPLSTRSNIMHYDVEVSGFPSSHGGHLVLLGLKEDDYPGTSKIEDWPSWTIPVLAWSKKQGAIAGYAHSAIGLQPVTPTNDLPNYVLPKMDGIGANEFVVSVTQGLVDFYSVGDTHPAWELNMWYHSLNCGYKTGLTGETDFPCISDERVGVARAYFKSGKNPGYKDYQRALKKGDGYISDGFSHLMNFSVNDRLASLDNDVRISSGKHLRITAEAAALLSLNRASELSKPEETAIFYRPWWVERARLGDSRTVRVELLYNGEAVDADTIQADGDIRSLQFDYAPPASGWVALRIFPSAHTNPVFIIVDDRPVANRKSAEWCKLAAEQCWKMKEPNIRVEEKEEAKNFYKKAIAVYEQMMK